MVRGVTAISARSFFAFLLTAALGLGSAPLPAQDALDQAQAEASLVEVANAIDRISRRLQQGRAQESAQELALREATESLAALQQSLSRIESELRRGEAELAELGEQQSAAASELAAQQAALQELLQASYLASRTTALQRLLTPASFEDVARQAHFTGLLGKRLSERIQQYNDSLERVATLRQQQQATQQSLREQQAELDGQRREMAVLRDKQAQSLASLQQSLASQAAELQVLETNQSELQELVDELRVALEGISSFDDVPALGDSRGSLSLPVDSALRGRFGEPLGGGPLTRQGLVFAAQLGTPVRAVHPGQVVFADFLQGRGMLVIVDHGKDYLSLYGNNEALAVSPGQWVDRGDVVATSGLSPRDRQPSVYFEIRHRGRAENPLQWLRTP